MNGETTYPSYKAFGKEIVESAGVDSLDLAELVVVLEEEFEVEVGDEVFERMTTREKLMMALETKLRMGDGFSARMFGIEIMINPRELDEGTTTLPPSNPGGSDPSHDHEPLEPHGPTRSGSEGLEVPIAHDERDIVQVAQVPVTI
jgi:acyl carrier protein